MAEADLVRRKPLMAGTLSAVAYSMEVHSDRCKVRTATKESRHSEQKNILSGQLGRGVGKP